MDLVEIISKDLKIPETHLKLLNEESVIALVDESWIVSLKDDGEVIESSVHEKISEQEVTEFFRLSSCCQDRSCRKVVIHLQNSSFPNCEWKPITPYRKHEGLGKVCSEIQKQNYHIQWLIGQRRFPQNFSGKYFTETTQVESNENDSLTLSHANLLMPYGVVQGSNCYIIKPFITHSVQHALMYSPNMLSQSNSKPLFLVYQLLQLFTSLSDSNPTQDLCCLSWSDIALDDPLWLRANLCRCDVNNADKKLQLSDEILQSADDKLENPPQSINTIGDVVDQWVCGKMSNFDYLMYLNKLAGRRSKDPHHHPILPWVSDLSSSHGGWRDLTKSKYRLNKGDDQLYLQYAMAAENSGAQVPHHVPDMLSDITYYVYMARRMSREVLQKHVRSYWEPNEYPSTIQRIQEWSPDECIPEFYTDPSVFHSIHPDMNDLGLPEWSQSPQQFVIQHMEMLESPQVSSKLHEWVDVTFGYKLRGRHAEEAMNVCRQLVDDHRDPHTHGIVQLFSAPHPHKPSAMDATQTCTNPMSESLNNSNIVEAAKDALVVQEIGEMRAGDDMMVDERNEAQKLSLPPDYNPFQWLDQLEKILCFKSSNTECASLSKTFCEVLQRDNDEKTKCSVAEFVSDKNTIVFLCLALELYLAPHMHCVVDDLPLSKRFQAVHACYNAHKVELPSVIRYPVEYILKALADTVPGTCAQLAKVESSTKYDPTTHHRLFKLMTTSSFPPPTSHHLLTPSMHIMHFPPYFHALYTFLHYLMMTTDHYTTPLHEHNFPDVIEMLHELLQLLHDHIEGFHILVPHIIQLLHQPLPHNVQFLIISFDKLAQELGPKESCKLLLPVVVGVFKVVDTGHLVDTRATEIYEKHFIIQLYHRFGLQVFMETFPSLMIEHLANTTAGNDATMESLQWIIMKFGPTLTSKYIARHLLGFLNACFLHSHGPEGRVHNHQSLIDCLIFAASMYGASYFTLQYIPHLSYNVSSAISGTKFTPRASAALDATTTVLLHLVPYWTDQILMDQLSRLSKEIILPLIGVLASKKFSFPCGGTQRKALCLKTVKVVVTIAVRIGRDMARQRMTGILQSFFSNYTTPIQNGRNGLVNDGGNTISPKETSITIPRSLEPATDSITAAIHSTRLNDSWISDSSNSMNGSTESVNISSNSSKDKSLVNTENDDKIIAEISETFCPETAYHAYVPFTRLMGGFHMERILNPHHDVIWKLSSKFENRLAEHGGVGNKEATGASGASPSNITMVGNQIVFHEANEARPNDPHDPRDPCDPNDETKAQRKDLNENENCQLTGNWLAYWEHEIGLPDTDNHIHFNQIDLQSFAGHSGAVRSMCVNNSEEWFVTGGKDKMVKIWSLHTSTCDTIQPSFTYRGHKKTPSHISILESDNTILTCDGSVHVWDPYTGQMVVTFDSSEFKSGIVSMTALPSPQRAVLAANSDAFIKLIDVRSQYVAQEYKTTVGASVGVVRTMCTNGNWVAVGFSSGFISLIDVRMGPILRMWQAHDSDITTSCVVGDHFLTASMDQTIAHWDTTSTKPRMVYRSITEPVTMVRTYHNEVISGSTSNRINVHRLHHMGTDEDQQNGKNAYDKPTTVTKLRSDTLKGTLSTFCILPMKRQLLMASDSGSVKLLA